MKASKIQRVLAVVFLLSGAHCATRAMEGGARTGTEEEAKTKQDLMSEFVKVLGGVFSTRGQFYRDLEKAKKLIGDPNFDIDFQDSNGMTPLMWATVHFQASIISELRDRGADPNIQEQLGGYTALMFAAEANDENSVRELLKYGYDLDKNIKNLGNETALDIARRIGGRDKIEILLEGDQ